MHLQELRVGRKIVGPSGISYTVMELSVGYAKLKTQDYPTERWDSASGTTSGIIWVDQTALDKFKAQTT